MAEIKFKDLGIELNDVLIISDLHIGYEEALNKQGVLVPRFHYKQLTQRLEKIISDVKPSTIVVNGDLKHEFGEISQQEWRETLRVIDMLTKNSRLIIIKGNHDTIAGPIAKKRNVEIKDHLVVDDTYIVHGNKIPTDEDFEKSKSVIMGHEHPALTLSEGTKSETFKCFLKSQFRGKNLYVLPSFNFFSEGTDITKEKLLSPILKEVNHVEVLITQKGDVYDFGEFKLL